MSDEWRQYTQMNCTTWDEFNDENGRIELCEVCRFGMLASCL